MLELIKPAVLHLQATGGDIEVVLSWLGLQFEEYYMTDNKRHRENMFELLTQFLSEDEIRLNGSDLPLLQSVHRLTVEEANTLEDLLLCLSPFQLWGLKFLFSKLLVIIIQ